MRILKTKNDEFPLMFKFNYDINVLEKCREIKKENGFLNFRYDPDLKAWLLKWELLETLLKHFTFLSIPGEILKEYSELKQKQKDHDLEIERSKVQPLEIDLPLFEYQKAGANFMVKNEKVLNCDEMGLGKSLQAIAVKHHLNIINVLVICPNSLRGNWQREFYKWTGQNSILNEDQFFPGINIINYEKLIKFTTVIKEKIKIIESHFNKFDLVIVDEAHYVKENKSKRTKIVLQICKLIKRVILLSGTLMPNRPKELITPITAIGKIDQFGSAWDFLNRYCNPTFNGFGMDYNGADNIPELKSKIDKFMIRRLKKEVLKDLPDKRINSIFLDLPDPAAYSKVENDSQHQIIESNDQYKSFYTSLKGMDPEAKSKAIAKERLEGNLKNLTSNVLVQIEKLKQETARQKIIASAHIFTDHIANKRKVIVFCSHIKTVTDLYSMYRDHSVFITGNVKPEDRMKAVDMFEKNKHVLFLICTMQTTGTGFNLTAASEVLFMELGWTPSEHKQCEDRAWRIGQKNTVNINYLIAINTIDEDIIELLNNKSEVIEGTFKGELLNRTILKIFSDKKIDFRNTYNRKLSKAEQTTLF